MGARVTPSKTKARLTGLSQLPSVKGFFFLPEYMKFKFMSPEWVFEAQKPRIHHLCFPMFRKLHLNERRDLGYQEILENIKNILLSAQWYYQMVGVVMEVAP